MFQSVRRFLVLDALFPARPSFPRFEVPGLGRVSIRSGALCRVVSRGAIEVFEPLNATERELAASHLVGAS